MPIDHRVTLGGSGLKVNPLCLRGIIFDRLTSRKFSLYFNMLRCNFRREVQD